MFRHRAAPAIFQRVMDQLLKGLPMVCGYLDDILVSGKTKEDHDDNVRAVLKRLDETGIRVNEEKCRFGLEQVEYLGYIINDVGLQPITEKVDAIQKLPQPNDVTQLRAFLGMINYYGKFLKNLSTTLGPLHALLKKGQKWNWSHNCETAFNMAKRMLSSLALLVHFDSKKEVILTCDASQYGIGAVLSHINDNNDEQPIAFGSRTLHPAEKKYSQIEKEALAVVFGVKKFHNYLFGKPFTINSDHKPLLTLPNEAKAIPTMVSGRIQRWAILLSAYEYKFKFKPGKEIANADVMSRLPLKVREEEIPEPAEIVFNIKKLDEMIARKELVSATGEDNTLMIVKKYIQDGWPDMIAHQIEMKPYWTRRDGLSSAKDVIWWGSIIVIPRKLQSRTMILLHEGHPGIV